MDVQHQTKEFESIGVGADWSYDWEGAKVAMCKLFHGPHSPDVQCIEVHLLTSYESGCWGSPLVVVPGHVILQFHQCCACLIEGELHAICELIHGLKLQRSLTRFKAHSWVLSLIHEKWRVLCQRMSMIVVHKLTEWYQGVPVILTLVYEDANILFEFLVNTFSLAIGL